MSGWSDNDMENLTNTNRLVNGSFITCGTGEFASSGGESTAERFIRAGSPTQLKAGVTAIGMSTIHTITSYNNCLNIGLFHGLYADGLHDMGQAFLRGKLNLHKNYGVSDLIQARTFCQISNLFGDPSMDVWVAPPLAMNCTYPTTINKGTNYVTFLVRDNNNQPMSDVWVTLTQPNDVFFASGYTDVNGLIVLAVNPTLEGTIDVVVSKPNFIATIGTIQINAEQPTVGYVESIVDDDNQGESQGNGNNLADAGETIELKVGLHNYQATALSNVTAILRTTDPYITMIDSLEAFPTIQPSATGGCLEDYDFSIAENCPNYHSAGFLPSNQCKQHDLPELLYIEYCWR